MASIRDKFTENEIKESDQLARKINNDITGRLCYTSHIHLLYLIKLLMGDKCKLYCETGTLFGGSLSFVMQDPINCEFIGVDLFAGYYGNPRDPCTNLPINLDVVHNNINKINRHGHKYHLVKGSSYADDTIEKVKSIAKNGIDLIFIDGDHSFNGVMSDFNQYKNLLNPGAYIMFDNYSTRTWLEVKKAVDSIDFDKEGFNVIGSFQECYIVQKK